MILLATIEMAKQRKQPPQLVLAKSRVAQYLKNGGNVCLFCGSDNITSGDSETDDTWHEQEVSCHSCHKEWKDIYEMCDVGGVKVVHDQGEIRLPCYGIVITHDGKGGVSMRSKFFKEHTRASMGRDLEAAHNAIEIMIISAARTGVDILHPSFICAIETAVEMLRSCYA